MAKVPLPPETPSWRKKKVKPEDMPISDAMQKYLSEKSDEESASRMKDEMADEEKKAYDTRGYAMGGSVRSQGSRGCGIATKGFGKGKVY